MIRQWLSQALGSTAAHCRTVSGAFALYDPKACVPCKKCTTPEVLRVECGTLSVADVDLEEWVKAVWPKGRCLPSLCDRLLSDAHAIEPRKVVFCELTCSDKKYISPYDNAAGRQAGKKAKAYDQLRSAVEFVSGLSDDCRRAVEGCRVRECIFAWRDRGLPAAGSGTSGAERSMESFQLTPVSEAQMPQSRENIGGIIYTFRTIKHDRVYTW